MKSLAARLTAFSTTTAIRLFLLAYPARFRKRFTDELVQSVRRDLEEAGDPLAVLPAVKAAIWSVNPEQRLTTDTVTLDGYMDRLIAQRRFNMALLVLFGVLALVIAAAGTYGVMAYVVAQRTGEIGVRLALGATPRNIVAMIMTNAGVLMAIGLTMGFMCARYLSATVEAFLFQVEPTDARGFVAAIATLALAGLVASALPARRAASVDRSWRCGQSRRQEVECSPQDEVAPADRPSGRLSGRSTTFRSHPPVGSRDRARAAGRTGAAIIRGRVTDRETAQPMARATVMLMQRGQAGWGASRCVSYPSSTRAQNASHTSSGMCW